MSEKKKGSALRDFIAGGVGGVCAVSSGHPLDTIKVREWEYSWPNFVWSLIYTISSVTFLCFFFAMLRTLCCLRKIPSNIKSFVCNDEKINEKFFKKKNFRPRCNEVLFWIIINFQKLNDCLKLRSMKTSLRFLTSSHF